jgi:hypothetical protein
MYFNGEKNIETYLIPCLLGGPFSHFKVLGTYSAYLTLTAKMQSFDENIEVKADLLFDNFIQVSQIQF